jgi:raffinose/stachyose/melibiose transport system substrate-binding protein
MGRTLALIGIALAGVVAAAPLAAAPAREKPPTARPFPWSAPAEAAPDRVVLTFRHIWTTEHDAAVRRIITAKLDSFMAEHPEVRIRTEGLDQEIHRQQKLKAEMVAGNPPEIFCLWGGAELEPYIRAGRMLDLTEIVESLGLRRKFQDLSMWERNGRVYGLPLEGFCELFYYNKAVFERIGARPPETVDDLVELCVRFRERGIVPIALGNQDRWPAAMIYQYCLNRAAGVGRLLDLRAGRGSWLNDDYRRGTGLFVRLVASGAFGRTANASPYADQGDLFLSGGAAMVLTGSWESERFGASAIAGDIGCFAFPAVPGGAGIQSDICAAFSFGLGFSAAADPAQRAAIKELIAALFAEDVQRSYAFEASRLPSQRLPLDETAIANPVFAATLRVYRAAPTAWPAYDGLLSPAMAQAFYGAAQALVAGGSAEAALESLERARATAQPSAPPPARTAGR